MLASHHGHRWPTFVTIFHPWIWKSLLDYSVSLKVGTRIVGQYEKSKGYHLWFIEKSIKRFPFIPFSKWNRVQKNLSISIRCSFATMFNHLFLNIPAEKCSRQCPSRNLVDIQAYKISKTCLSFKSKNPSEKISTSYICVSIFYHIYNMLNPWKCI